MSATHATTPHVVPALPDRPSTDPRKESLRKEGKIYIVRDHISAVIQLVLLFATARTLGWYNAWLYAVLLFGVKLSNALLVSRYDPAVLNARGTKHPMEPREKLFFAIYVPSSFAILVVAGLDAGVVGWSHHSMAELALGIAMLVVGTGTVIWAVAMNAFFEVTVRFQRDRGQRVCREGPYRFVRHPGYVGAILASAAVPLILGSYWAFVPVSIATVAFVVRTAYEDRMLRADLEGYETYASETRYRLLPFIW